MNLIEMNFSLEFEYLKIVRLVKLRTAVILIRLVKLTAHNKNIVDEHK